RAAGNVSAKDGVAGAALLPPVIPLAVVRVPPRRAGGQHLEPRRRAVAVRRGRQAVFPGQLAAVTLVADHRVLAAEGVAALQAGPLEQPVPGAVDGELRRLGHELAV